MSDKICILYAFIKRVTFWKALDLSGDKENYHESLYPNGLILLFGTFENWLENVKFVTCSYFQIREIAGKSVNLTPALTPY